MPGGWKGERGEGRGGIPRMVSWTIQFTTAWLMGVGQTALVSGFKAWLKALRCYQCVPYIFWRKSTHYCAFQSPSSRLTKKPILKQHIQKAKDMAATEPKKTDPTSLIICISVMDLLPLLLLHTYPTSPFRLLPNQNSPVHVNTRPKRALVTFYTKITARELWRQGGLLCYMDKEERFNAMRVNVKKWGCEYRNHKNISVTKSLRPQ